MFSQCIHSHFLIKLRLVEINLFKALMFIKELSYAKPNPNMEAAPGGTDVNGIGNGNGNGVNTVTMGAKDQQSDAKEDEDANANAVLILTIDIQTVFLAIFF